MLPSELLDSAIVHIAALRTAERQLMFAQACRAMGLARLSAGTYGRSVAGERGALVIQGEYVTHVPSLLAVELDPTGAGDTFCGATLAGLARREHPVMAARGAVTLAAEMIGEIGPTGLVSDRPATGAPTDDHCRPNAEQIRRGYVKAHLRSR